MAQNVRVIPCDICDGTDDVNSFCVNCKQNYCDNCKKGHLRSASSKHHKFLSIGDGLLASKRQGDTCTEHNDQVLFFCKTCGKATCSACVTGKHKKHDFDLISQMVSGMREKLEKTAAYKENEIENVCEQINSATITSRYTENAEKNISIIKETVEDWIEGLHTVNKELIKQEQKEAEEGMKHSERDARISEEIINQCLNELHDVKVKLRICSDAALIQHESEISGQLAAIAVPSSPIYNKPLPIINMRKPTTDSIRAILEIQKVLPQQATPKIGVAYVPPKLLDNLQVISRFKLPGSVFDIATLPGSMAWITIRYQTMLVDINGKILVQTKSRIRSAVAALSNGDVLFTSSDNVISRIDQTGKVSVFSDIRSYVSAILTMNNDVFVAVEDKIFKLDHTGRKQTTLNCNVVALTSMPGGEVAAIDGKERMMMIQVSDCRVMYKDKDVSIGSREVPAGTAFTADQHGRIIRGHASGKTIHVFQVEGENVTRLKDYNVDMLGYGLYSVDTDDSGNLWIGTIRGGVIIAKYCQSE